MTEDVVILDVEGSEVVVFEASDPPDVIDGQEEVFLVSAGEQGPSGVTSALPGGTTGQLRAKASNADYDEVWIDPPESLPAGGTTGQILTKRSSTDGDAAWDDPAVTGATPADIANLMAFAATNG